MKKIIIYSDCFVYSGSENVIENLIKSSDLSENSFFFYYANNKNYREKVEEKYKLIHNVKPIPILGTDYTLYKLRNCRTNTIQFVLLFIQTSFLYFLRWLGILSIINFIIQYFYFIKIKPDILIINNGGYPGSLSCRIAALTSYVLKIDKVIMIVNNMALQPKNIFDNYLDFWVDKSVNYFLTASKAASVQLRKVRNISPNKCINIPNTILDDNIPDKGILRKDFNISDDYIVIGSVGLLTHRKGFHIFIEAIKLLQDKNQLSKTRFFIFGEGEDEGLLKEKIRKYQLENIVLLPGFRSNVMSYVYDFDIFVLPSISHEDFPYVIIEAMAMGKVVIATNVAGIPEQVTNGETGLIVAPNNSRQLADSILSLIYNKNICNEMGEKGREKYKNSFSYSKVMRDYGKVFSE